MAAITRSARAGLRAPGLVLLLCLFATQATLLVVSPILAAVAEDLGVSTATAGQLRTISGAAGVATALLLGRFVRGRRLRDVLLAGLALLAAGSVASAAAPSFALLAGAQVPVGVGLGIVLSAALAAAGAWDPQRRSTVLSWALIGQPAAWVLGMPLVGVVAESSWRATWLVLPLVSTLLAAALVALRPRGPADAEDCGVPGSVWRHPGVRGWAAGETLAYAAWAGTLVYAGALFVERYQVSTTTVGVLLAAAAFAYVPGNVLARRWVDTAARRLLALLPPALAVTSVALGAVHGVAASALLLAGMAFASGARTIAGSALGLDLAPERRLAVMGVRTAATQAGYLLGAALGGAALALGGYTAVGAAFAALFLAAAVPHLRALRPPDAGRVAPAD